MSFKANFKKQIWLFWEQVGLGKVFLQTKWRVRSAKQLKGVSQNKFQIQVLNRSQNKRISNESFDVLISIFVGQTMITLVMAKNIWKISMKISVPIFRIFDVWRQLSLWRWSGFWHLDQKWKISKLKLFKVKRYSDQKLNFNDFYIALLTAKANQY